MDQHRFERKHIRRGGQFRWRAPEFHFFHNIIQWNQLPNICSIHPRTHTHTHTHIHIHIHIHIDLIQWKVPDKSLFLCSQNRYTITVKDTALPQPRGDSQTEPHIRTRMLTGYLKYSAAGSIFTMWKLRFVACPWSYMALQYVLLPVAHTRSDVRGMGDYVSASEHGTCRLCQYAHMRPCICKILSLSS